MKIHLIGIGGTGMGALAGLLRQAGHEVRGSDHALYPPMSTVLEQLQIPVFEGFGDQNLAWQPDRVVVGNVCRKDHEEVLAAEHRGLQLTSFPALLNELFLQQRRVIVVAGTHGKTTTASMMASMLDTARSAPGYLIGGIPLNLGRPSALGQPPFFVVEGDEYDCAFFDKRPKFVHYNPHTVILTGVEFDHADIYPSMKEVEAAFSMLIEQVPEEGRILVCADSPVAMRLCQKARAKVESYSLREPGCHWGGTVKPLGGVRQLLEVRHRKQTLLEAELKLSGIHNASNALAVAGVALGLHLSKDGVAQGLRHFKGVRRRQEVRGVVCDITVIDDFAHHPTAIAETLAGLKEAYGRIVAIFEPRSATSRRNIFQDQFVDALQQADHVVVGALHAPETIPEAERLSPQQVVADLVQRGTPSHHIEAVPEIVQHLKGQLRPGDTVVVMSSGGFGGLIDQLLEGLKQS